jgi:hypothetical protein
MMSTVALSAAFCLLVSASAVDMAVAGTTGGISGYASMSDGAKVASLPIILSSDITGPLSTETNRRGFFSMFHYHQGATTSPFRTSGRSTSISSAPE